MALPNAQTRAGRLGSGVERAWRGSTVALSRYAEWLGGLSWKRFFLVALLVLVLAAIASSVPPLNLRWGPDRTVVQPPRKPALRISDDDPQRPYEIRIDDQGVRIGPAPGKPASAPEGAGAAKNGDAADGAGGAASAPRLPPSVDIKLPPGADADEVREAIEEARAEIKAALEEARPRARVIKGFSPGDYLPEFALLLILASIIVKVMGAGQRKAEARAAEAAEIAEGEALKRQVVEARMAAMQAQVEPHFLFNTLASIDHLIETDAARASRMQKNLIALLRASMPTMRETAASGAPRHLERELAVVRPYLEILKMRMEERLSVTIDVPDGLLSAEFPPMVMQSLVENAVKHGLEPKPEGGSLAVKAEIVHGKLAVTVADTGLGFGKTPVTSGTGVGLANIRERLQLLYGSKATLTISENRPSGTVVTVTVPYVAHTQEPT